MITMQQFKQLVPNTKYPQQWYDALFGKQTELGGKTLLEEYEITTPKRIAAFMAQCGHESGGFVFLSENLNYSAAGLMRVFPKYFPDDGLANQYARHPQQIAARVYGGRMGNGPEETGEGWLYHGRGLIQITSSSDNRETCVMTSAPAAPSCASCGT